jgi:hypothetical protein
MRAAVIESIMAEAVAGLGGKDVTEYFPENTDSDPELWLYRERTVALLRRYMRLSGEIGRLPSLLGREFFRTRVTSYHIFTFEDAVIFVHDVERCLELLDDFQKKLIAIIVLQQHSQDEAARRMRCKRRTVGRRYTETLDRMSELFLEGGVLTRWVRVPKRENGCQGGQSDEIPASETNESKYKY